MSSDPDSWVYGDFPPDANSRDLPGLKARWILQELPGNPAARVLDYGVGEGKYLSLLRTYNPKAQLVGVDIRTPHNAPDFEFHQVAPDAPLPFATDSYDVVISCDVLEHVASIDRSLREIHRVLRVGGSFIGFVPAEGGAGAYALFRFFNPNIYRDTKDHEHAYTRRELLSYFSEYFRVVKLAYSYHLLGSSLDAAFFAAFKMPLLGPRLEGFWRGQDNDVYRSGAAARAKRSLPSRLIQLSNRAAYYESRALGKIALGAKGLHFHLQKR